MKKLDLADVIWEEDNSSCVQKKVWYVAIIGRPNVGKSTFLNTLIGEKVSITSQIPQTTRNKILAIHNTQTAQIIFLDTPWIHKSEKKFNEEIVSQALSAIWDADLVLYFIDGSRPSGEEEAYVWDILSKTDTPIIHVITKSDLNQKINFDNQAMRISSKDKAGFEELLLKIESYFCTGPLLYPEEIYTQQKILFRISEIIREKAFMHARQELPHSIYVHVEDIEETEKMYRISSYIYTESESQKYIIIGKWGTCIKDISTESRKELEQVLQKKVFLTVRVKVRKNWRKDENFIKKLLK